MEKKYDADRMTDEITTTAKTMNNYDRLSKTKENKRARNEQTNEQETEEDETPRQEEGERNRKDTTKKNNTKIKTGQKRQREAEIQNITAGEGGKETLIAEKENKKTST